MEGRQLSVEIRGADGNPLPAEQLHVRPLDHVIVRGVLETQPSGAVALVAEDGWFLKERPKAPPGCDWSLADQ